MGKAGGIIGIVAGVLGILAALFTLLVGGLGSAFEAKDAGTVVGLGWGGIVFSLLAIVFGAVGLGKPKAGGTGLILGSLAGIVMGGTLVAIFMALSLIGGILAAVAGWKRAPATEGTRGVWISVAVVTAVTAGMAAVLLSDGKAPPGVAVSAAPALAVGQTAQGSSFQVTLRSFALMPAIKTSFGTKSADADSVYAVLEVSAKCVDKESRYYTPGDLVATIGGREIRYDKSETMLGLGSPVGQINPLVEKRGFVVFKLPREAAAAPLTWQPGRGFDKGMRFALASPPAEQKPVVAAPAAGTSISGRYTTSDGGSVVVEQTGPEAIRFQLLALNAAGNMGEAEGTASLQGNVARWRNEAFDCKLEFRFGDNAVEVAQQGPCGFGLNVTAAGRYARAK